MSKHFQVPKNILIMYLNLEVDMDNLHHIGENPTALFTYKCLFIALSIQFEMKHILQINLK